MSKLPEAHTIIPVDPKGKYAIVFKNTLDAKESKRAQEILEAWWADPSQHVLILSGNVEIHKVDGAAEVA